MSKQFPEPEKSSISFIRDLIEAEKMANFVNSTNTTGVLHSIENLPKKPQQIENVENHCNDLNNKNSMSNIIFVVDSIGNVMIKKNGNLYKESESKMLMEINKNEITADEQKNNDKSDMNIGLPQNNDFVENNVMKELPKLIKTLNVNATPFDYEKFKSEFEKSISTASTNEFVVKEYENENIKHDVTPDLDQRNVEQAKSQLTKDLIEHSKLLSDRSREESVLNYLSTVEITCPQHQDGLIDLERTSLTEDDEQLGSLSGSEEDDELKPLMIDNHTTVDHHEFYALNYPTPNINNNNTQLNTDNNISNNNDANNNEFSSAESDLSTQYDHRDLTTLSQHSSEDYKDSGLDTISLPIHKAKKIIAESVAPPSTPASATSPRLNNSVERMDNQISNDNDNDIDDEIKEIDTLSPMEVPDDQLSENIVEQVEFYFSNESLLKDAFLLKHVKRNKEGFVSLKLISSFKRVRQFTKDWRVVGHAIRRKSRKTELNDLGTKVRRLEPLPSFDETMPSRTIVVCDLPYAKLSIENISEIFSKCGEIALIRILRPGMQIPVDVRQFMNKYPEMQQKECALVEYLDSQSARTAKNLNSNGVNFKIYEMVAPKKKTGKKSITTITKFVENYKYSDNNYEKNRGGYKDSNTFNYHDENRYNTRRNSSEYYVPPKPQTEHQMRPQQQPTVQHSPQIQNCVYQPPHMTQRRYSTNSQDNQINHYMNHLHSNHSNIHYNQLSPRRISNCSVNSNTGDIMMNHNRKYSNCSDGYSSCSELSRRPSTCSSSLDPHSRRTSCSEHCPCGSPDVRRMSNIHRKISECSEQSGITRRISNSSLHGYDRDFHNDQQQYPVRKISSDSIGDRKISSGSAGSNYSNHGNYYDNTSFRKYSNGFDPNRKLSNTDQYYMGRRISTDSGYDRRMSFGSEYSSSPRSRTNSFLSSSMPKSAEAVVRTPIGPDGSKGFASRARKIGQVTSMQSQTAVN